MRNEGAHVQDDTPRLQTVQVVADGESLWGHTLGRHPPIYARQDLFSFFRGGGDSETAVAHNDCCHPLADLGGQELLLYRTIA